MSQRAEAIAVSILRYLRNAVFGAIVFTLPMVALVTWLREKISDIWPNWPYSVSRQSPYERRVPIELSILMAMALGVLLSKVRVNWKVTAVSLGLFIGAFQGLLSREIIQRIAAEKSVTRVFERHGATPFNLMSKGLTHRNERPQSGEMGYPELLWHLFLPSMLGGAACGGLFALAFTRKEVARRASVSLQSQEPCSL